MSTTEEHHRRLLAITNTLITETDPARLFRAVAAHLRGWLPFASIGIAYFDAESEIFDHGMAITSDGATLGAELFPITVGPKEASLDGASPGRASPDGASSIRASSKRASLEDTGSRKHVRTDERQRILDVLESSNWIIEGSRGAAKKLGIKPSTLRGRMAKMGIERGNRH